MHKFDSCRRPPVKWRWWLAWKRVSRFGRSTGERVPRSRVDDVEETHDGRVPWRALRHHLGITSFGINSFTGKAQGDRLINEHDEDEPGGNEELYLVLHGRARFEIGSDTVDAPTGTFVFVPPKVMRTAFAEEAGTTLVAIGGVPGHAYEPGGWRLLGAVPLGVSGGAV